MVDRRPVPHDSLPVIPLPCSPLRDNDGQASLASSLVSMGAARSISFTRAVGPDNCIVVELAHVLPAAVLARRKVRSGKCRAQAD